MSKSYKLDLSNINNVQDLGKVLNCLNITYTKKNEVDFQFEEFKGMGIIGEEIPGRDVKCDVCNNSFKTAAQFEEVECPNCTYKTYVE